MHQERCCNGRKPLRALLLWALLLCLLPMAAGAQAREMFEIEVDRGDFQEEEDPAAAAALMFKFGYAQRIENERLRFAMLESDIYGHYRLAEVDKGEDGAAGYIRINDLEEGTGNGVYYAYPPNADMFDEAVSVTFTSAAEGKQAIWRAGEASDGSQDAFFVKEEDGEEVPVEDMEAQRVWLFGEGELGVW